jgi:hypothetical protein
MNSSYLIDLGIKVGRGWQAYDAVVKKYNKAHTYADMVHWAVSQTDGGISAAQRFQDWYTTDNITLGDLEPHLQALAVITHFAEVARGYSYAVEGNLYEWIAAIAKASNAAEAKEGWSSYKNSFHPSLKYGEDKNKDYIYVEVSDIDIDSGSEISAGEVQALGPVTATRLRPRRS